MEKYVATIIFYICAVMGRILLIFCIQILQIMY